MINFNGSTKRRNINLSGNRKPLKNLNNSFLDQLNQERTNRSKAKQELNAAIKLQSGIRRYQKLKEVARSIKDTWDPQSMEINVALREFTFIANFLPITQIDQELIKLSLYYRDIDLAPVTDITFKNFFSSIVRLYTRLLRQLNNETYALIYAIAEIALSSVEISSKYNELPFKSLLNNLNESLVRFATQDIKLILRVLFAYSEYDLLSLIRFLSLDYSTELMGTPPLNAELDKVLILRDWIASPESRFDESDLTDDIMLQFLGNFILVVAENNLFEPVFQTMRTFSHILNFIHSDICFIADLEGDSPMTNNNFDNVLVADYNLTAKIERLYSKEMMAFFFKDMESNQSFEEFSEFLYSSLHLLNSPSSGPINDELKSQLLTNVIVSSSCYELIHYQFHEVLINDSFADCLINESFNSELKVPESRKWWGTLYALEEVFTYILMFQNDKSISKYNQHDMLATFVTFLKSFCLYIALNGKGIRSNWNSGSIGEGDFEYLVKLSLKLFNQLYLRNSRMHFVDDEFWTMKKTFASCFRFNTETVINLLKRKDESENDEDGLLIRGGNRSLNNLKEESNGALYILIYMPFLIPFETRAQIFQALIESDRTKNSEYGMQFFFEQQGKLHATISRENLLFDAFEAFGDVSGEQFKKKLDVSFVNQFGPENGIDGGGLTKEFLTSVCKEGFQYVNFDDETLNHDSNSSDYNFFKQTPDTYQIYPSTDFYWRAKYQQQQTKLHGGKLESKYDFTEENQFFCKMMKFLGMVIGKCLYENVLLDISFAPFFLSKWCSLENLENGNQQYKNSFDDLKYLDNNLYQNLIKMLSLSDEDLKGLELYFSISEKLPHQLEVVTADLIPNGSAIQVDQTNKLQYVYAVANFKLNTLINTQTKYFLSGLFEIIQPRWLNLFSHIELLMLVSGGEKPVDVEDLKANTIYGGYLETDLTIKYFWEVVEEFTPEERSKLIKFVTSSPKAPLLGFKDLAPKFGIRDALDTTRLPTSSTCTNLLKLPDYRDKKILRDKLLYAINAGSGFDLS